MAQQTGVFGFTELAFTMQELSSWQREVVGADILEEYGYRVEQTAKDKIGTLQGGSGSFPAWQALAAETIARKARGGRDGADGEPLLGVDAENQGHMRDAITHDVVRQGDELGVVVGIPDGDAASVRAHVHEFGGIGPKGQVIPERPFLRPALEEHAEEFVSAVIGRIDRWEQRAASRARVASRRSGI